MFAGKSILITGGTGSFGKNFIETILRKYPDVKRLIVSSRDELKQYEMSHVYPESKYPQMRYFIGDIRDGNRLYRILLNRNFPLRTACSWWKNTRNGRI